MFKTEATRPPTVTARLRAAVVLFVCTECSQGRKRRRDFKDAVKVAGRKREVRVVGCGCLDLCPKRGTATALACRNMPTRIAIVDDSADTQTALDHLLDEGVGNPVPH